MNELSIEEKAKAYDNAVKRANSLLSSNQLGNAWIYKLLPELKKSKDERIADEIIQFLYLPHPQFVGKRDHEEWIAWLEKQGNLVKYYEDKLDKCACDNFNKGYKKALEKQGEQPTLPKWKYKKGHNPLTSDSITLNKYGCVAKSPSGALVSDVWILDYAELANLPKEEVEKEGEQEPIEWSGKISSKKAEGTLKKMLDEMKLVVPKFKVGDWVAYNHNPNLPPKKIIQITNQHYVFADCSFEIEALEIDWHLWTIQDAKDGDVLNSMRVQATIIFKGFADDGKHILAYSALQKGIFIKEEMLWDRDFEPCPKNWNDELFSKMHEAGYEWDADKKELKKKSTEEYNPYKEVVESIAEMCKRYDEANHSGLRDFYDNVKVKCKDAKEYDSLYPQSTWKPSNEQMKGIECAIKTLRHQLNTGDNRLNSLYNDLKKL